VIPPPVARATQPLPLDSLEPRDFEKLCLEVAERELGRSFHLYGRSGDEQHGIDVMSDDEPDERIAIQCKRVESFHPADVQHELAKVATYPNRLEAYYLFIQCEVSPKVRDFEAAHYGRTKMGPITKLGIWDKSDLDRRIAKYPNLIGAYFGLAWRDCLHPHLKRDEITDGLSALRAEVAELKRVFARRGPEGPSARRTDVREVTVEPWLDGYFMKTDRVVELHGNFPSGRGFSFTHELSLDFDRERGPTTVHDDHRIGYSIILSPDEALDFEGAALIAETSSSNDGYPVYYVNSVFIGGPRGTGPRISFPLRDFSINLFSWDSLWNLRALVTSYLDRVEDAALAARRVRLLAEVANGVPMSRALLHQFKYE
jgi:hypothetical protein